MADLGNNEVVQVLTECAQAAKKVQLFEEKTARAFDRGKALRQELKEMKERAKELMEAGDILSADDVNGFNFRVTTKKFAKSKTLENVSEALQAMGVPEAQTVAQNLFDYFETPEHKVERTTLTISRVSKRAAEKKSLARALLARANESVAAVVANEAAGDSGENGVSESDIIVRAPRRKRARVGQAEDETAQTAEVQSEHRQPFDV